MSDQQSEANPLFFHAILLFVLSVAVIVMLGIIGEHGIIAAIKESKGGGPSKPVGANTLREMDSAQRQASTDASALTRKPTGLTDIAYKADAAKRLAGKAKGALKFIVPALMILVGASIGFVGLMLIQKKNWARHVGFAMVSIVLLYYTWLVADGLAATMIDETGAETFVEFQMWKPLVLVVIAAVAGKFLWDLNQESFAPAEPVAA